MNPAGTTIAGKPLTGLKFTAQLPPAIHAPVPDSVVQVIRSGISPPTGALGRSMPAFGPQMSEAEMTALVQFLRARFMQAPWKK